MKADLTLPDMASLSYYQKLNDKWDILGDVTWTGWSSIQELRIVRTTGSLLSVLPENFKDTWRFSAGVNYQYNDKTVLRAGVAYDQSPVNDIDRSARLPDNDRTWLTIGGRYKYSTRAQLRRRRGLHLRQGRLDRQFGQSGQHRRQRPHQR